MSGSLRADRVRKSGLTVDPVGLSIRNATRPGFPQGKLIKKKKNQKRKTKTLWKLPQLWKSTKEAFGDFFLMISTAAWKSLRKTAQAFPQLPQVRRRRSLKHPHQSSVGNYKGLSE
jgi:hypothetical protein